MSHAHTINGQDTEHFPHSQRFPRALGIDPFTHHQPQATPNLLLITLGQCAFSRMSHNGIIWVSYDFWSYLHFIISCLLLVYTCAVHEAWHGVGALMSFC